MGTLSEVCQPVRRSHLLCGEKGGAAAAGRPQQSAQRVTECQQLPAVGAAGRDLPRHRVQGVDALGVGHVPVRAGVEDVGAHLPMHVTMMSATQTALLTPISLRYDCAR